jgi:hypothetical protein
MNIQQLLRHWNSKSSLRSRDKVIRLMWPVLREQAGLHYNNPQEANKNSQQLTAEQEKIIQEFLSYYLQEQTPSENLEELIAPFDSNFSPYEWRLIVIRRFFTKQMSSQ